MIAAEALSQLKDRLAEALQSPVEFGEGDMDGGPGLRMVIHSMAPVPDVSKMTGRHLADQATTMSWVFLLILKGEAESQLAAVRLVDPHNNFHQCALACAVAADQSDHVAGAHIQINALKHRVQAEGLGDPAYRQQSAGG